ncbi:MAG: ABC transporter permease [Candidatus Methylarchaceae archaeon HK02M2]|nr:ABC transporter permease [Candidatus Methylarchaceae archaeon HK02M2]
MSKFRALLKYELIWNLRKRKFQALLVIIVLIQIITFIIPAVLSYTTGQAIQEDPYKALSSPPGIFIFLFAIAVGMNSISEEFEHGRAHILFSKPVSRTLIYLAKIIAALIMLTIAYLILNVIGLALSYLIYGPQEYIIFSPILLLGILIATLIYLSIVFFLGAVSKSSIIAALGSFGILIGLGIMVGILGTFGGYAWIADYVPSGGQNGVIIGTFPPISLSTGTDNLGTILSYVAINPEAQVNVTYVVGIDITEIPPLIQYESQMISIMDITIRALMVTLAYTLPLLLISWFIFRRTEIKE